MKKILRINLTNSIFLMEEVPYYYSKLGGRGLSSNIICNEVPPKCEPLREENKIVLAPGILSGTKVLCSGRLSIGTKSPLTNTIKETNAGGVVAEQLTKLGFHAVIIEGSAREATCLIIDQNSVTFNSASSLKGKGVYDCVENLRQENGNKAGIITIGPAGEMKLKASAIAVSTRDQHVRFAARGGVGAVMGAKNIKAIVIDNEGEKGITPDDKAKLNTAAKALSQGVLSHPLSGALKDLGTPVLVNMVNSMGALSTKNFSKGKFEKAAELSGENLAELINNRPGSKPSHACMKGCVIQCSNVLADEKGDMICASIEFETLALLGSNCLIEDIETVAKLNHLCNDLGLDTMDVGGALALAMEAELIPWGDGRAALSLIKEIYQATEAGKMIGNGARFTGEKLGVKRIPAVKGQCLSGYDPRGLKGTGVTYATSTMGADHTCGNALPSPTQPEYNPQSATGQAPVSKFLQDYFSAIDSLGLCLFASLPILDIPELKQHLIDCVAAVTGQSLNDEYIEQLGKSVTLIERNFNLAAGFKATDDRLPAFFSVEKLPETETTFDVSNEELDSVHS